jgi:phosphatidate cytidylyltransferase
MSDLLERFVALSPAGRMMAITLAILVLSSVVVWGLRRARPAADFSELAARVRSWWVMATVFFAAILVDQRLSLVFFALLSFWALKEYVTLLETRPADHRALFWAFVAVPAQYTLVGIGWYGMFVLFIPVYMFLFLPLWPVIAGEPRGFVRSASQLQWGLMAFVFGLSHMGTLLLFAEPLPGEGVDGRSLVLFLVFVTEMSDVLQYVWGKLFGRHRILPTISPNKTWEGFVGGVLSAAALSLLVRFLTPFSPWETVRVALLIGVVGFFGGAVMSAVKRDLGVKDFGQVIPGHGGVLDRVDSLCYAAPVFFHYVRYFY